MAFVKSSGRSKKAENIEVRERGGHFGCERRVCSTDETTGIGSQRLPESSAPAIHERSKFIS